jgi:hypothetical protein
MIIPDGSISVLSHTIPQSMGSGYELDSEEEARGKSPRSTSYYLIIDGR